ncbi:MAG: TonB-dependent receptor, partial [Dokdonella sp.]
SVVTGGNPDLQPETSETLTVGAVYSPTWAEGTSWSQKVDFEVTYYRITLEDAIQASDAQTQLDRCVATLDPLFCGGIGRSSGGNINAFDNTLFNLGTIKTRGFDVGVNWLGNATSIGTFGASLQSTYVDDYSAISNDSGLAEPRGVGIEVADSAIPEWRATASLKWSLESVSASWSARYISELTEDCTTVGGFDNCSNASAGSNRLGATTFHDVRASWKLPTQVQLTISGGINNVFDKEPPICQSCSLNGYDASTYDLPGRFSYVEASVKF